MAPVIIQLQIRKDTAANWTAANPVLLAGEPAYETDTGLQKIGDGTTAWNSLDYAGGGTGDGDVFGPASSTNDVFPLFDGVTGKLLKNSTYGPTSFAPLAFTYTDASTFEVNHAENDQCSFKLTFVNNSYPSTRTGKLFFGSLKDNHAYFYKETEVQVQEYVGNPDWGGTVSNLCTIWSAVGLNAVQESATVDGDLTLDSVVGTFYLNFYVWQEASSYTPEMTIELDSVSGIAYMSFSDAYSGDVKFGIDANSVAYLELVGETGSYLKCGSDNVYLEGSYAPTRNWGILASAPSSGMIAGDMYYNSGTSKACYYTGSAWVDLN